MGAPPDDLDERTIVFLDCGNIDRMPVDFLQRDGLHILNIDHHHDNTRFGTVNLVVPEASCTAEIVWRLAKELGAEITPEIADALYVGPRHRHRPLHVREHHAGVAPHGGRADRGRGGAAPGVPAALRGPSLPPAPAAPAGARQRRAPRRRRDHARHLIKADYEETGALETDSEGVVDHLRAVEGTAVAVLVRELLGDDREGLRKVSLRATDGRVDVSASPAAGRRRPPAGGRLLHRAAVDELIEDPREQVARAAPTATAWTTAPGVLLVSQAGRGDLARRGRRACAARCRAARRSGHAGTLDPFATGLLLVLVGRATRAQRFLWAFPRPTARWPGSGGPPTRATATAGSSRPGGCPSASSCPGELMQRPPAFSAVKVGGEPAYGWPAGGRRGAGPRPVTVSRAELCRQDGRARDLGIECSAGTYVRSLIASSGTPTARSSSAPHGPFRLEDADPERLRAAGDALGFLPDARWTTRGRGRAATAGACPARGKPGRSPDPRDAGGHRRAAGEQPSRT